MRIILAAAAAIAAFASPAFAGGDWDAGWHGWRGARWYRDYPTYYEVPAYVPRVYYAPRYYVPYDYYVDEDYAYGRDCEIERKWKHGRWREKIDCDD